MSDEELIGAVSISTFCELNDLGKTFVYEEIKKGRLEARKAGTKTLILRAEAKRWAHALPKLEIAPDHQVT